jgi:hypothetical protein
MKIAIGIDPGGSSGCVCILYVDDEGLYKKHEFLEFKKLTLKQIIDRVMSTGKLSRNMKFPIFAQVEKVSAMPGQGISSTFKFGMNYGNIISMLLCAGLPFEEKTPSQWMKIAHLQKLSNEDKKQHKNRRRHRAESLYPQIKISNANQFDALLLSHYALMQNHNKFNYASN